MASPSPAVADQVQPSSSALQRGYSAASAMDLPPNPHAHPSQPYPSSFNSNYPYTYDDRTTEANTAANAGPSSYPHHLQQQLSPFDNSLGVPPQQQGGRFTEEWDASQRGSSLIDGQHAANMQRSTSVHSYNAGDDQQLPTRGNTLKKKNSTRRGGSVKRSSSRRSMRAGSVKSLALQSSSDPDEAHSAFHCPVPTSGNPTDVLAERFQSWRKVLKDLIAYFREIQSHYEHKSKSLLKLANVSNNITTPPGFLNTAGIDDALHFIRVYNKNAILETNKAKEIEEDVILALTGLRSDLQQKIKEIKNLSGDFKNSVEKEMDHTRKAVKTLSDVLGKTEVDESSTTGKQDPYLLRLAVDRQVERQIDEENYLHQAYLNLESSGRELESIVVGEIQKAYNAYAGILKREADNSYTLIEELRSGPVSMPKDQEWIHFVTHDNSLLDPTIPLRSADQIHYPGQGHETAQEIRAGLLERKSKYLKSYTAGWYVLSATHLHEFKSADKAQAPVMSLYLPEQKLGSHSSQGGSSNKFILKGRQTGTMHRGHTWVFRAESHDTMMAWYEDIKALTEKTPEERSQFVRSHSRSLSRSSRRSVSSDGLLDEDEDEEPFSADSEAYINPGPKHDSTPRRSLAGGRFPSDIQVNAQRGLQAPHSPSSLSSSGFKDQQHDPSGGQASLPPSHGVMAGTAAAGVQGRGQENNLGYGSTNQISMDEVPSHAAVANEQAQRDGVNPYTSEPIRDTETVHHHHHQNPAAAQQQPSSQARYQDQDQNGNYIIPVMGPQGQQHSNPPVDGEQQQYSQHSMYGTEQYGQNLDGINQAEIAQQPYQQPGMNNQYYMAGGSGANTYDQEGNNIYAGGDNYTYNEGEGYHGSNGYDVAAVSPGGVQDARSDYAGSHPIPLQDLMQGSVPSPAQDDIQGRVAESGNIHETDASIPTPPPAPIPVPAGTSYPATGEANPVRPTSNNIRNDSVQTISNLHIPGGYPKSAQA